MQFQFGAEVRQRDGGKIGDLTRLVFDPGTRQIVSLVVERGFEAEEVVVPIGTVQSADDEAVQLELTEDQFAEMEPFEVTRNVAPPPDTEPDEEEALPDVPDVPAIGAATGIESIAYTPILEEEMYVPTGNQVIDSHTSVWATDGQLGNLKEVRVSDETERIASLIVERGFVFKHDYDLPMDLVAGVRSENIVLTVPRSAVEDGNE